MLPTIFLVALIGCIFPNFAFGKILSDHVEVSLLGHSVQEIKSKELRLGLHYKLEDEWHIYWKNPGDSGAAPKFQVRGAKLLDVSWPPPKRIPLGDLTNFGYEKEVLLFLDLELPDSASHLISVDIDLEWLVCKVECIPGFGKITLSYDQMQRRLVPWMSGDSEIFAQFQSQLPVSSRGFVISSGAKEGTSFVFRINSEDGKDFSGIKELSIFPEDGTSFLTSFPKVEVERSQIEFSMPVSANVSELQAPPKFVLVQKDIEGRQDAFSLEVPLGGPTKILSIGIILLAFLGGLILNAMPCVFPVLSLKIFSFLKEESTLKIRKSSLLYTAGVLCSFLFLGALLIVLRSAGLSLGWGFQLQESWFVYSMILLFFLMGLSFLDFFGTDELSFLNRFNLNSELYKSDFMTGVLAVIVASPCTAPFMGSAMGLTLMLPAYQALLIFFFLGLGLAAPILMLAFYPRLRTLLPKPGSWMIWVKKLMGVPLLLTCIWLLWVLQLQKGNLAALVTSSILVLIFLFGLLKSKIILKKKIFSSSLLLVGLFGLIFVHSLESVQQAAENDSRWSQFDEKLIEEKRKTVGVFIDFTAAWCITCQFNKKNVLQDREVVQMLDQSGLFLVRADWTNHEPRITAFLAGLGRNSIPVYAVLQGESQTDLLPELLTKDIMKKKLEPFISQKGF